MDCAFAAGALLFLKGAFVQAHEGIVQEFGAFGTEFTFGSVFFLAVKSNHCVNRFFLALNPGMFLGYG